MSVVQSETHAAVANLWAAQRRKRRWPDSDCLSVSGVPTHLDVDIEKAEARFYDSACAVPPDLVMVPLVVTVVIDARVETAARA